MAQFEDSEQKPAGNIEGSFGISQEAASLGKSESRRCLRARALGRLQSWDVV